MAFYSSEIKEIKKMEFKKHWTNIKNECKVILKNECKYVAMYFFKLEIAFVIELKNMYKSLDIIDKMTTKYINYWK
jgi:hypothetical protein